MSEGEATFGSGTDKNLESRSAGHSAVTVGHVVQADGAVEHPAWLDPSVEHVGQQFLDVGAGRSQSAGESDVAHEHAEVHRHVRVLRYADPAHHAAVACHTERRLDRWLRAN